MTGWSCMRAQIGCLRRTDVVDNGRRLTLAVTISLAPHALRLGAVAVFVSVFAGCNVFGAQTSAFVVPLPENDFGQFELWVYDESELITGGHANQEARQGIADSAVTASPDLRELEVELGGRGLLTSTDPFCVRQSSCPASRAAASSS